MTRTYSRERLLRRLEQLSHAMTTAAFLVTLVLVTTGYATELNLVAAELLSSAGWAATGLLALGVLTASFWYFERSLDDAPRVVLGGAGVVALLSVADLGVNLWLLAEAGLPETVHWAAYGTPAALVATAGLVAVGRRELVTLAAVVRADAEDWSVSPQQAAAVAFALLLVVSGVGPFASFGGLVTQDHSGTAAAAGGTVIDDFEDGNDSEWSGTFEVKQSAAFEGDYGYTGGSSEGGASRSFDAKTYDNISFYARFDSFAGSTGFEYARPRFVFRADDGTDGPRFGLDSNGDIGYIDSGGTWHNIGGNLSTSKWYKFKFEPDFSNHQGTLRVLDANGTLVVSGTVSFYSSANNFGQVSIDQYTQNSLDFDYLAANGQTVSEPTSGPTGRVTDGAGDPVANATVVAEYNGENFADVLIDGTPYQELKSDPLANLDGWQTQQSQPGFDGADIQTGDLDVGGKTVLMHRSDQWGLEGPIQIGGRYFPSSSTGLGTPKTALGPDENPTFSCWQPTSSLLGEISEDELEAEVEGFSHATCDAITVERVDPLNDTVSRTNYSTGAEIVVGIQSFDITSTTYEVASPDLDEGMYRVYPQGQPGQATMYVVAPNGDVSQLEADIENWASSKAEAASEFNERVKNQYSEIPAETVTTNESGYYTLSPPSEAESVDIRVMKAGVEDLVADPTNLSSSTIEQDIESATRSEFEAETTVDFQAAYQDYQTGSDDTFQSVCQRMASVSDQTGAPLYGEKRGVPVPNGDLDVQGERVMTTDLDPAERTCVALNQLEALLNDPSSVLPGLPNDFQDLTRAELNELLKPILPALTANEDLKEFVEAQTGIALDSENPEDYSTEELKVLATEGLETVETPPEDIPTNIGGQPGGIGGIPQLPRVPDGGDTPNVPTIGDGDGTSNRTNGTLSYEWPIANVDNWDETQVLIRISGNGSADTIGTNSSYVDIDENAVGTDTVTLEEYPVDGNAAAYEVAIDVISPQGMGRDRQYARNPTFDGTIPDLKALRVSTRDPGPSNSVTVEAQPDAGAAWGGVTRVEVTGPDCSKTVNATDDEATFTTCGEGGHRVAVVFQNSGNATFTEVVRLDAGATAGESQSQISAASGPTGRYAIASGSLESGSVEVLDGASVVELTAITPANSDPPSRVIASTVGIDAARGATTEVQIREGSQERTIRQRIPLVVHTDPVGDETLLWRNGQPIRNPGESPTATVSRQNSSTVIDTYTSDDASLVVTVDRDPGPITRLTHSIGLRFPALPVASLAMAAIVVLGRRPPRFGSTAGDAGGSQEAEA